MGGRGFPPAWRVPCNRGDAVRVLAEVEDWLVARARLHALLTSLLAASSLFAGLALGYPYSVLAFAVAVFFALLGVWGYRGNMSLARSVREARRMVEQGLVRLDDYCGRSVLAFIALLEASGILRV